MPQTPRAIVLTWNRLSRRCLGCYGHEWIETPNLDRFAARAVVFDQCFAPPQAQPIESARRQSLLDHLQRTGVRTVAVEQQSASVTDADSAKADTSFADLLAQGLAELDQLRADPNQPWLLWLHANGVEWPCVASEEFAELYADELTDNDASNDPLKVAEVAYAANVTELDHHFGQFLNSVRQRFPNQSPLIVVAALAGEDLGESEPLPLPHVDTSPPEAGWALRDELVHSILLIANAQSDLIGSRRQELVQWPDVMPTLEEFFRTVSVTNKPPHEPITDPATSVPLTAPRSLLPLLIHQTGPWRDSIALLSDDGAAAIRTSEWLFVEIQQAASTASEPTAAEPEDVQHHLYLKPDDVWEINDVAEQFPHQVATGQQVLKSLVTEHAKP